MHVVLTYNVQCHVVYTAFRTVVYAGGVCMREKLECLLRHLETFLSILTYPQPSFIVTHSVQLVFIKEGTPL